MVVHSTGVSLNEDGMATANLFKTLVSKEKRWYKEGGYDLDLTCIPPSSIVSVARTCVSILYLHQYTSLHFVFVHFDSLLLSSIIRSGLIPL